LSDIFIAGAIISIASVAAGWATAGMRWRPTNTPAPKRTN
jgi:hypothetical protein